MQARFNAGIISTPFHAESVAQERVVQMLKSGDYYRYFSLFGVRSSAQEQIKNLPPSQLHAAILNYVESLDASEVIAHPQKILDRITNLIPTETLTKAVSTTMRADYDPIKEVKRTFEMAKFITETVKADEGRGVPGRLVGIKAAAVAFFENIISDYDFSHLFENPGASGGRSMGGTSSISMLYYMSATMGIIFTPIFGPAMAAQVIAGLILVCVAANVVYPYVRPIPAQLPKGVNITKQYYQGDLEIVTGRKATCDQLAKRLISNQSVKKHPLLLGDPGVGKTHLIRAFVAAIERGDYPELAGKEVFYFKGGELQGMDKDGTGIKILERIANSMGHQRKNMIIVVDEFHALLVGEDSMKEKLLTMLDHDKNTPFPYFIALTTPDKHQLHMSVLAEPALNRRFEQIRVTSMTHEETVSQLSSFLLRHAPHILVADGALDRLARESVAQFPHKPQPGIALELLANCITEMKSSGYEDIEQRQAALNQDLDGFTSERQESVWSESLFNSSLDEPKDSQFVEREQSNIAALTDLRGEQVKALTELQAKRWDLRMKALGIALKIGNIGQNILSGKERELADLQCLNSYLLPKLTHEVRVAGEMAHRKVMLDTALIDSVVAAHPDRVVIVPRLKASPRATQTDQPSEPEIKHAISPSWIRRLIEPAKFAAWIAPYVLLGRTLPVR